MNGLQHRLCVSFKVFDTINIVQYIGDGKSNIALGGKSVLSDTAHFDEVRFERHKNILRTH